MQLVGHVPSNLIARIISLFLKRDVNKALVGEKVNDRGAGYGIGSNCPGISRTVPDLKHLSRVPEGSATCLLLVPDEGQTLA